MQKTAKIVLLLCFCFHSFSIFAQHDEYIAAENRRIANTKQTEKEIEKLKTPKVDSTSIEICHNKDDKD